MRNSKISMAARMHGHNTLDLGEDLEPEISDDELSRVFLSKYMKVVQPRREYETYFANTAKDPAHILNDVKRHFVALVLNSDWTERKYAKALDVIFREGRVLSAVELQKTQNEDLVRPSKDQN